MKKILLPDESMTERVSLKKEDIFIFLIVNFI